MKLFLFALFTLENFLVCQGLQGQCFQMSNCYVPADKTSDTEPPLHG